MAHRAYPGCPGPCRHQFRTWPIKDRGGAAVPHTFLFLIDHSGGNPDYDDDIFIITNVAPVP